MPTLARKLTTYPYQLSHFAFAGAACRVLRNAAVAVLLALAARPAAATVVEQPSDAERAEPRGTETRANAEADRANGTAVPKRSDWSVWTPLRGVTMGTTVTADLSRYRNPLFRQGAAQSRSLSMLSLRADLESAVHWPGLTLMVSGMLFQGADQTAALGSVNGGTSIDALPFRALGEAWVEQRLARGIVRLKAGRMDANTEFAASRSAQGFLRPGAGLDPTMAVVMPTYPLPANGVNVFLRLSEYFSVAGGLFDGRPSAAAVLGTAAAGAHAARFGIAELDLHSELNRVVLGAWRHTSDFSHALGASAPRSSGIGGIYAVADQRLLTLGRGGVRALNAFAQLGVSNRRLSDVAQHASVGLMAQGPAAARPADQFGVSLSLLTVGDLGAAVRNAPLGAREAHLEMFYAAALTPWLTAAPDVQYVPKPIGRRDGRNGTAFTLRFILSH